MRSATIARNYAEALFALGEQSGQVQLYGDLIDAVAAGVASSPRVQAVLVSPRVTKAEKGRLFAQALPDAPPGFVRFLQSVIKRGRQMLLTEMASEFHALHDLQLNRIRAAVTVARPVDERFRQEVARRLTEVMGKQVIPQFHEDPAILGGVVVRMGDRVFDGSVRRRMTMLRRTLLAK